MTQDTYRFLKWTRDTDAPPPPIRGPRYYVTTSTIVKPKLFPKCTGKIESESNLYININMGLRVKDFLGKTIMTNILGLVYLSNHYLLNRSKEFS